MISLKSLGWLPKSCLCFALLGGVASADLAINFTAPVGRGDRDAPAPTVADFQAYAGSQLDSSTELFSADPDVLGGGNGGGWTYFNEDLTGVEPPRVIDGVTVVTSDPGNGFNAGDDAWNDLDPILEGYAFGVAGQTMTFTGLTAKAAAGDTIVVSCWGIGDNFNQQSEYSVTYGGTTTASQTCLFNEEGAPRETETNPVPVVHFTIVSDGSDTLVLNVIASGHTNAVSLAFVAGSGGLTGDLDGSGVVDCADANQYAGNIGATPTGGLAGFDLDGDSDIDAADAAFLIENLAVTSNGQTGTFLGDLNCDGSVNVLGDAFVLVGGLGTAAGAVYTDGDLNFDGAVSVLGDAFVLVGNLGMSNNP